MLCFINTASFFNFIMMSSINVLSIQMVCYFNFFSFDQEKSPDAILHIDCFTMIANGISVCTKTNLIKLYLYICNYINYFLIIINVVHLFKAWFPMWLSMVWCGFTFTNVNICVPTRSALFFLNNDFKNWYLKGERERKTSLNHMFNSH